jgi:hypothetical protein
MDYNIIVVVIIEHCQSKQHSIILLVACGGRLSLLIAVLLAAVYLRSNYKKLEVCLGIFLYFNIK